MNILYRFQVWLDDHLPVECCLCGRWLFAKDADIMQNTLGKTFPAHPECKYDYENPYSKAAKK